MLWKFTWPMVTLSRDRLSCWVLWIAPKSRERGVTLPLESQKTGSHLEGGDHCLPFSFCLPTLALLQQICLVLMSPGAPCAKTCVLSCVNGEGAGMGSPKRRTTVTFHASYLKGRWKFYQQGTHALVLSSFQVFSTCLIVYIVCFFVYFLVCL